MRTITLEGLGSPKHKNCVQTKLEFLPLVTASGSTPVRVSYMWTPNSNRDGRATRKRGLSENTHGKKGNTEYGRVDGQYGSGKKHWIQVEGWTKRASGNARVGNKFNTLCYFFTEPFLAFLFNPLSFLPCF